MYLFLFKYLSGGYGAGAMAIKASSLKEAKKCYKDYKRLTKSDCYPNIGEWELKEDFYLDPLQKDDGIPRVVLCEWYQE